MNDIEVIAKIQLFENASQYFQFPRSTPFRTSIWEENGRGSSFCSILPQTLLKPGTVGLAQVTIAAHPMIKINASIGMELRFGVFPIAIGSILIVDEILDQNEL
ncbi:MAG: hypothetical protein IPN95_30970 [Bacteroidetes bacterium]|jgi:hypothetical protein|nr:hypothetical protein [Bacteroidota bacterium]